MDYTSRLDKQAITVQIPNVERDERIGSTFNHLFRVIGDTEDAAGGVTWDFSATTFFHPFFLAPLAIYRQECGKHVGITGVPARIATYLDTVCFAHPLETGGDGTDKLLDTYATRSYTPVCQFDLGKCDTDKMQTVFQGIIRRQSGIATAMTTPLSYMLGELVDNMNEHSDGSHGYLFSQYLKREGCIDIVIADNGRTVYGSYVKTGRHMTDIGTNEAEALKMANLGMSTKNRPDAENRGYGISTSKRMLVKGMGGAFFMLSGGAFHRSDRGGDTYINLPQDISWRGTVVLLRIPDTLPAGFDYTSYME